MINWLQNHVWIAAWLSPLVALIIAVVQSVRPNAPSIDWSRLLLYLAFLTGLAVAFTPLFDAGTRTFAQHLVMMGVGFLIVDRIRK